MLIFVTGGYRSGRSSYALRRAAELGPPPWLYVTSGEETDESVRRRIERFRRDKEAIWQTGVLPDDLRALAQPGQLDKVGAAVIDGFFPWLSARAKDLAAEAALLADLEVVADQLYRSPVPVLLVSQEIGLGVMPADPDGARLVKLAAAANQILAGMAHSVVMMVSGVPLKVR
jgi:adenosylcobinamide kinase/adenosylcobinamide-phosphate guanylyltransferase